MRERDTYITFAHSSMHYLGQVDMADLLRLHWVHLAPTHSSLKDKEDNTGPQTWKKQSTQSMQKQSLEMYITPELQNLKIMNYTAPERCAT